MGMASTHARFTGPDRAGNADAAVEKLRADLADAAPAQLAYFAAPNYDPERLAAGVRGAFPGATTFGCSTSGEIADGVMLNGAVAALAFGPDVFDFFAIDVVRCLAADGTPADPRAGVDAVLDGFERKLDATMDSLDFARHVGIVLADGRHYFPEPVLDRIGERTNVTFIGGLAGDEGRFRDTPVFLDGAALRDAALVALARPRGRFAVAKTQGLKVSGTVFTVTRADEPRRVIHEFNGRPAAAVYGEAIGRAPATMDLAGTFARWPFGLMVDGEPLLRVAIGVLPDGGLQMAHAVAEGMRLVLSTPEAIVPTTAAALERVRGELGGIGGMLHFNCMSRHQELASRGELEAFGRLFRGFPNAGFSGHGEIYVAIANQTSTMLVFAE